VGRPRTFDTATVLDAAVAIFWERGYEATSITDLERATGLSRSSIYQAFGDKRGLYHAALERYRTRWIEPRLSAMAAPDAGRPEIRAYLTALARVFESDPAVAMRGCLVVNGVSELGLHDERVRRAGLAYRAALLAALTNALAGAGHPDPAGHAEAMCAAVFGALVVAHFDPAAAARGIARMRADLLPAQ
jgi:TetR/AcrR family transcriptional repressor of nem operon